MFQRLPFNKPRLLFIIIIFGIIGLLGGSGTAGLEEYCDINGPGCVSGLFCNYDQADSGFCEACSNFPTVEACENETFIHSNGHTECSNVCHSTNPGYSPFSHYSHFFHNIDVYVRHNIY